MSAYGGLLRAVGWTITTHADGRGGLICEARAAKGTLIMWQISSDGGLLPDRRYNFRTRAFVSTGLPGGPG